MQTVVLKYGLVGGAILTALGLLNWLLLSPFLTGATAQIVGYLGVTLSMLCVPLGMKYYRDRVNAGQLSLGEGIKIGLAITLITSAMMFLYGMFFHIFFGEEFMEWQQRGLSAEELAELQAQFEAMPDYAMDAWFQGLILFSIIFLIGIVMTLLGAFVLRQSKSLN